MNVSAFRALAEPNRLRILDALRAGDCHVGDLTSRLELGQPAVSRHLKVLRDCGFVTCRVAAQRRIYRLQPRPFEDIEAWLGPYRQFWAARLDALATYLDEQEET